MADRHQSLFIHSQINQMKKKNTYGGIVGHTNELELSKFIKESKDNGDSYRIISDRIRQKFGISPSHTTVSKYAKEILKYKEPDQTFEVEQTEPIDVSQNRIEEIRELLGDRWSEDNPTKNIYATILALAEQNVSDHISTGARLKIEYVKYLYDLKRLLKSGFGS